MPAIALLVKECLSWLIKVVTTPRNIEYNLVNRCASHAELEYMLYGYVRPKTALNMKQVCKIAYFYTCKYYDFLRKICTTP